MGLFKKSSQRIIEDRPPPPGLVNAMFYRACRLGDRKTMRTAAQAGATWCECGRRINAHFFIAWGSVYV